MYTGMVIDELMASVERAEEHACTLELKKLVRGLEGSSTCIYEPLHLQKEVGAA